MMRVRPLLILLVSHLAVRGDTNVSENSRLQAAVALERMYAKVSELEKRVVAQAAGVSGCSSLLLHYLLPFTGARSGCMARP